MMRRYEVDFIDAKRGQNRAMAIYPLTEQLRGNLMPPIFDRTLRPFAKANPLGKLALAHAPLAANFERRQVVFSDHPLQGPRGHLEHLCGLAKSKQPKAFQFFFHRVTPKPR